MVQPCTSLFGRYDLVLTVACTPFSVGLGHIWWTVLALGLYENTPKISLFCQSSQLKRHVVFLDFRQYAQIKMCFLEAFVLNSSCRFFFFYWTAAVFVVPVWSYVLHYVKCQLFSCKFGQKYKLRSSWGYQNQQPFPSWCGEETLFRLHLAERSAQTFNPPQPSAPFIN